MIGKVLVGVAGAVISLALAAPAGADPVNTVGAIPAPQPGTAPASQPGTAPASQPGTAPASQPGAVPASQPASVPGFLAAARAAGVTGADPAMLEDGYDVCWQLWNQHAEGTAVATGLARDHPGVTVQEAANFVLAAYHDLCPVPGAYDYWAYSTG